MVISFHFCPQISTKEMQISCQEDVDARKKSAEVFHAAILTGGSVDNPLYFRGK